MRTQVSSHSGSSSIGECIAMFCERGIMWAIQSIIVITEILPFIFWSIQSSVQRTSSLGSAPCKYKQQVQTTLVALILMATPIQGLALAPMIDMENMNSQVSITLPTTNATPNIFKTEGEADFFIRRV